MPKHRTSFIVTIQTDSPVKATSLAKMVRNTLSGVKVWYGEPCGRQGVSVQKVTVVNVGEK
jgi:hypothetical protein